MRLSGAIHRVNVVFKPEGEEKFSTEECVSFSTAEAAKEFAERQKKRESVLSVKIISTKEH